jgi:hypothetical protein
VLAVTHSQTMNAFGVIQADTPHRRHAHPFDLPVGAHETLRIALLDPAPTDRSANTSVRYEGHYPPPLPPAPSRSTSNTSAPPTPPAAAPPSTMRPPASAATKSATTKTSSTPPEDPLTASPQPSLSIATPAPPGAAEVTPGRREASRLSAAMVDPGATR